ncbi:hypothetical protein AB0K09_05080 [Streptomyces sp. NPDC049577]|uniref:hypothetical protein n=1 Tax=Streptomyces sp. NPDC049577 TaxID=3155153 RepID=UPI003428099C
MGNTGRLATELESLRGFKGRVDELLTTLGDSEAAPSRIGADRLVPGHLGKDFDAAASLYDAYHDVHSDLEDLSRLLSSMIDALSTAVRGAHDGYATVDADQRDHMWAVQKRLQEQYAPVAAHTPGAPGSDKGSM